MHLFKRFKAKNSRFETAVSAVASGIADQVDVLENADDPCPRSRRTESSACPSAKHPSASFTSRTSYITLRSTENAMRRLQSCELMANISGSARKFVAAVNPPKKLITSSQTSRYFAAASNSQA